MKRSEGYRRQAEKQRLRMLAAAHVCDADKRGLHALCKSDYHCDVHLRSQATHMTCTLDVHRPV